MTCEKEWGWGTEEFSGADLSGTAIDDTTDFRMANLSGAVIAPEDLAWAQTFWARLDEGEGA